MFTARAKDIYFVPLLENGLSGASTSNSKTILVRKLPSVCVVLEK